MNKDFNTEEITLPSELTGKLFLTMQEFAKLAGVSRSCVYGWGKKGFLRLRQFQPRCHMVPKDEVLRYLRGEMMDPRTEGAEPKPK